MIFQRIAITAVAAALASTGSALAATPHVTAAQAARAASAYALTLSPARAVLACSEGRHDATCTASQYLASGGFQGYVFEYSIHVDHVGHMLHAWSTAFAGVVSVHA